jgi:hypothetical protein
MAFERIPHFVGTPTRKDFLQAAGAGFGSLALAGIFADEATATVEAMTVSTDVAQGMGGEGFFSKYKWWLLGGAAIVAYTQREAIMRMVKR